VPKPIVRVRCELEPVSGSIDAARAPIVARATAAHALAR
jgi:hypothetical protein